MNAYVSPSVRSPKQTIVQQAGYVEVGMATKAGAIVVAAAWTLFGLLVLLFGMFGVDLFATVAQAQWVTGAGLDIAKDGWFTAVVASVGIYLVGIAANLIMGGLVGALSAWLYNVFTVPEGEI